MVTLTEAPQAFVRVRVRLADGRKAKAFPPSSWCRSGSTSRPFDERRKFRPAPPLARIARTHVLDAGTNTPFGLSAAVDATHHAACERVGLNGLVASFGLALIERAIIDALGRLEGASVFELVRSNRIALTAATAPDLAGFDFDAFLADLRPAPSILRATRWGSWTR